MLPFRLWFLIVLGSTSAVTSSYAQRREALLINGSARDNISLYYSNVLLKYKYPVVRPGDTLRVVFDEDSFTHIIIRFGGSSEEEKTPELAVLPGDVISIRRDKATGTYDLAGKQAAELRFYEKLWRSRISLSGWYDQESTAEMPATLPAFMCLWQDQRQLTDDLLAELRATPGIRPAVAVALTRELRLRTLSGLLLGIRYHALYPQTAGAGSPAYFRNIKLKIGEAIQEFPPVYRDSVLAQARRLHSVEASLSTESEQWVAALQQFITYVALSQGRPATYSNQYALAKREYSGAQREWACYAIMHSAQISRKPFGPLLKDYRSWMMPESRFVRSLTGQDQLTLVMPDKLMAAADTLTRPDGTRLTLAALLAQHRGKVIYLEFWASWCAPCVWELPASAALRQHYRGQNVVVLYLSIDEDQQKWQRARAQFLPRVPEQYRFTGAKTSRFVKRFAVTSIPRYILLDKYGILRYAEAPHPDDPALKAYVATLLAR